MPQSAIVIRHAHFMRLTNQKYHCPDIRRSRSPIYDPKQPRMSVSALHLFCATAQRIKAMVFSHLELLLQSNNTMHIPNESKHDYCWLSAILHQFIENVHRTIGFP